MKPNYIKLIALLSIIALAASVPDMTFDPTASVTPTANIPVEHPSKLVWFHPYADRFVYTAFDKTAAALNRNQLTLTPVVGLGVAWTLKALSGDFSCAAIYTADDVGDASGFAQLALHKFSGTVATVPTTPTLQMVGKGTVALASSDITTAIAVDVKVADNCDAIKLGATIYHMNVARDNIITATALPAMTNPVYSSDLQVIVANDGIYTVDAGATAAAAKSYTKKFTGVFSANKKIWTIGTSKIVVHSWAVASNASRQDYKIQVYTGVGTPVVFTEIVTISGQSDTNAPTVKVTDTLQTLVASGLLTDAGVASPFYKGVSIDYTTTPATVSNLQFPPSPSIFSTVSDISISDTYLYIRNNVANTASPPAQEQGAFFIVKTKLFPYFKGTYTPIVGITRTIILPNASPLLPTNPVSYINVYHQTLTASTLIGLEPDVKKPVGQLFEWDRTVQGTGASANTLTGAVHSLVESTSSFTWWMRSTTGSSVQFSRVWLKPDQTLGKTYVQLPTDTVDVALSPAKTCAVLYKSTATIALGVYYFAANSPTAVLYKDILALAGAATGFEVSDDCTMLRISAKYYYWDATLGTPAYVEITDLPTGTSAITFPSSSSDFNYVVGASGVYKYIPKAGAVAAKYSLALNGTYLLVKTILKNGDNIAILSTQPTAADATLFNFKVSLVSLVSGNLRVVGQFTGTSRMPIASYSDRLTKVAVSGIDASGSLFYIVKHVDWVNRVVKDVVIPDPIKVAPHFIAVSDDFLYARASNVDATGQFKQYGYNMMGNMLIEQFNQYVPYPVKNQFKRAVFISDLTLAGKLTLGIQFNGDDANSRWIRIVKDQRKSAAQILNPNPQSPLEMTFTSTVTVNRQPLAFGKWSWVTDSGTKFHYVEYDPSVPTTRKRVLEPATAMDAANVNVFQGASANYDCVAYSVSTTKLNIFSIDSTGAGALTLVDSATTAITATVSDVVAATNKVVGPGCWAIRLTNTIFLKTGSTPGSKYTVSTTGSALAATVGVVFDPSLAFAIKDAEVFKYVQKADLTWDYVSQINATGLKTTKRMLTNPEGNKVVILSYQDASLPVVDFVAKMWALNGNVWEQIAISFSGSTTTGNPVAFISPDFQTIGVWWGNPATASAKGFLVKKVDFVTKTATAFTVPAQWTAATVKAPVINVLNNFVYFLDNQGAGNCGQNLYSTDKINNAFVKFSSRTLLYTDISGVLTGATLSRFVEDQGRVRLLLESQAVANTIVLNKVQFGSPQTQQALKGLQTAESGLIIVNGQPIICPPGCATCPNPTTCTTCSTGFALDATYSYCVKCSPLCASCAAATPTVCTACFDGYYNPAGGCLKCSDSCRTCSAASTCTACKVGTYLTGGNTCDPCIDNCLKCADATTCLWTPLASPPLNGCKLGFVYSTTILKCVKCLAGCTVCNPDKITECIRCGNAFYPVTTNVGGVDTVTSCTPCSANCVSCTSTVCSACRPGLVLKNNICVEPCRLPCQQCSATDPTSCTSCLGTYTLNGAVCQPDLSCNTGGTCTNCPLGFNLVAGKCYQCQGGANCRTCDNADISKCSACVRGYYLTSTLTCLACSVGCAQCDDPNFCKMCKAGFTLSGDAGAPSKCVKCDDTCATCGDGPLNCITCATGYNLDGWKCKGNKVVEVNFRLDGDFNTLTTAETVSIEDTITKAVDKSTSAFTFKSIAAGSIVVIGQVDASSTSQQTAITNVLAAAFSTGSIGGYSILSSSFQSVVISPDGTVSIVYNTDDDVTKYRNIAIIVGVVIPIGLIILFIIFFILYKKGIVCANDSPTKVRDMTMDQIHMNQKDSELGTMKVKH